MFELMLFGLPLFWYALIVLTVVMVAALEYESGWIASLSLAAFVLLLWMLGDLGSLFTMTGLSTLVAMLIAYFVLGTGWAVAKWYFFLIAARDWYTANRNEIEQAKKGSYSLPSNHFFKNKDDIPPRVKNHKGRITLWIAYWPWSALWTLTHDPITKMVVAIYHRIGGLLQHMSDRVFADVK